MTHRTQENITYYQSIYYYWFIIKDTNEQPDENVHRARSREALSTGVSVLMEFGVCHPPGMWELSEFLCLGF